jgi:hypothetical protein
MRFIFAFLLAAHGIAHLPGFLVAWKIRELEGLSYRTTIFGTSMDVGARGIRAIGVAWMLAAIAFVLLAAAVAVHSGPWREALPIVLVISVLLCAVGWPEARIGIVANAVIALLLLAGLRGGVFGPDPWSSG